MHYEFKVIVHIPERANKSRRATSAGSVAVMKSQSWNEVFFSVEGRRLLMRESLR